MKKVRIKRIINNDYYLIDENNKEYIKNIEFASEYKPQVEDIIYISDKILYEINLFSFGDIYNSYKVDIDDIIKIVTKNKDYYMQRRYG